MDNPIEIRPCSSLEKIFPQQAPSTQYEKHYLSALCNETVAFQIAYKSADDNSRSWGRLKVGKPADINLVFSHVRNIPGMLPANYKTDEGYLSTKTADVYPDLLEPFDINGKLFIIPGIWKSLWVDVEVPVDCTPGLKRIRICIESVEGNELAAVEITVDVISAQLPPLNIPHTRWFHTDCLAEYYDVAVFSERYWEIVENFASYAARNNINSLLTPIFTPPLDTAIGGERLTVQLIDVTKDKGKYTFGFDKLERWVKMLRRAGIKYIEISHLFTQWGAKYAPKIMGVSEGEYVRLFGWETDATGLEYTEFLQQMLPALTTKLQELGVADDCFFHISDEPDLSALEQYKAVRKIVDPLLKGYKIVDALTDYDFYKHGAVTVPIPSVDHIEPFIEGNVPELWAYFCCAQSYKVPNQFFMQPLYRCRILGVLLYKYNIKGFLHWGYNFYNSANSVYSINPFVITDADGAFPSGDAFLVYPGKGGEPMGSIRLMATREAFNDYRALTLLEQLIGRDFVLELIDENVALPITFDSFPQSEGYLLNLRHKVNNKIKELIKLL